LVLESSAGARKRDENAPRVADFGQTFDLVVIFILTLHNLYGPLISGAFSCTAAHIDAYCREKRGRRRKAGGTMNSLDRFMEYLVAGVFVCVGLRSIYSYKRRPRALGAREMSLPFGVPYWSVIAVGLFEIAAALALVMPIGAWPQTTLVAAGGFGACASDGGCRLLSLAPP